MDPYSKTFAGGNYDLPAAASESLEPYRDLDPSRLLLHGRGEWDATDFLSDYLVMPYREPRALLSGLEVGPHPAVRDDPQTVAELAGLWDRNSLLTVHSEPVHPDAFVKVFNCFKSATTERQIGDRRGPPFRAIKRAPFRIRHAGFVGGPKVP